MGIAENVGEDLLEMFALRSDGLGEIESYAALHRVRDACFKPYSFEPGDQRDQSLDDLRFPDQPVGERQPGTNHVWIEHVPHVEGKNHLRVFVGSRNLQILGQFTGLQGGNMLEPAARVLARRRRKQRHNAVLVSVAGRTSTTYPCSSGAATAG